MDWITWAVLAAFALLCLAVWLYLRRHPVPRPREDDMGSTPRPGDDE